LKGKTELSSETSELSSVTSANDLGSFIENLPKLVEIICYCLNPNHFHLLLKQLSDKGIEMFMHKLGTGYTNFFNAKYQRNGSLFQGPFKARLIESDEDLFWLSVYINGNAQIHKYVDNAQNYLWCSYQEYLGSRDESICNKKIILDRISVESYKNTVEQGIPSIIARKLGGYLIE
jgi:REP element-mobilizing transposase RayT